MGLLSDLLTRPFKRSLRRMPPTVLDRRGAERFETNLPVSLRRAEMPPFAGSLINISMTGAAITLHGWNVPLPAPWPTRLKHGDEIALTGLLTVPLEAWVVGLEDGVMRVRFLMNDTVRAGLHELIDRLASVRR